MPYRMPLIFLTAFYNKFPDEDARTDRRLAHWIWRGTLTGVHSDSSDARIEQLLAKLKHTDAADELLDGLLSEFDSEKVDASLPNHPVGEIEEKILLKRAASKAFLLGLLGAQPRRPAKLRQRELWEDEDLFEDAEDLQQETTQTTSPADTPDPVKVAIALTDRGLLSAAVAIRLPGVCKEDILSADAETLRSYLLDEPTVERLAAGDLEGFLVLRRAILTKHLTRFVADRWGAPVDTRPSIRSILARAAT
jgi:hypothetical protein